MTQRGTGLTHEPTRSITPPAADVFQVPPQRLFTNVRSIGPGAAADIIAQVRPQDDLETVGRARRGRTFYQRLLREIEGSARMARSESEQPSGDPTWGFRVFVTSFSAIAREQLNQALANLVQATLLELADIRHQEYREELSKRFKLDIVEDESLEDASDDRIREEFRTWMRNLGQNTTYDDEEVLSFSRIASQLVCLVLDEPTITTLATLTVGESKEDRKRLQNITVRVIDCDWRRNGEVEVGDAYRGVGNVSVVGLASLFEVVSSNDGFSRGLHSLNGMPT